MQSLQERGRPIWFNQMEQHLTLKCLLKTLDTPYYLTKAEEIIVKKTRDKFRRYVNEQGRLSNDKKKE